MCYLDFWTTALVAWQSGWQEEHDERIRLEENLKLAEATIASLREQLRIEREEGAGNE